MPSLDILNPNALDGLNNWYCSSVSIAADSSDGDGACWLIADGGQMLQIITPNISPMKIRLSVDLKPAQAQPPGTSSIFLLLQADYQTDSSRTIVTIPMQYNNPLENGWYRIEGEIETDHDKVLDSELYLGVFCPAGKGAVYVDNFICEDIGAINTISENNVYYGVSIGRAFGLKIEREDGKGKALFNADQLTFQADKDGVMLDKLYFDPVKGQYIFNGEVIVVDNTGQQVILNSFGLDTNFIKSFKNLVWNSQFESYNEITKEADFWDGGIVSPNAAFFGTVSLKLAPGESTITTGYGMNPQWYAEITKTRMAFYRRGGQIKVEVLDEAELPYTLNDNFDNSGAFITCPIQTGWLNSRYTVNFEHGVHTAAQIKFTNVGATDAYIDAVSLEPDYTGMWPSFYTDGPNSDPQSNIEEYVEYAELDWNDTGVEFILSQRYQFKPIIIAGIMGDPSKFTEAVSLIAQPITEIPVDLGVSVYTKIAITPVGTMPTADINNKITIQAVCRGRV